MDRATSTTKTGSPEHAAAQDSLSIELIRRKLPDETVGCQIYLFSEVPSTNSILRKLAKAGAREGTVVLAETQSAGHGRPGKSWFSPPGVNLYASVLFRPEIPPAAVPIFSFITSLAVTEAIWAEGLPAAIKWPNDVLVERKKVAGTLVEVVTAGERVEYVILGVGVNLNVERAALRAALGDAAHAATSLSAAAGREIDRNNFAGLFLAFLAKWAGTYGTRGADAVLAAWRDRDILTGRRVEVRGAAEKYDGRVLGLDRDGHLMVEDSRGARHQVLAGEVRLLD